MTRVKAVIFDMDGLMVDTEPLSRQAWNSVLAEYGVTLDDALYHRMIGRRADESTRMVLNRYAVPLTAAELQTRKRAAYAILRDQGVPVMPGLRELHREISRRGLPWAVATSSPREHAQVILRQLGWAEDCQAIAAGDEVAHGKPAPDIYLLAAERLGVAPEHCLALEDSVPGCQAAMNAGMVSIAVPGPHAQTADFPFAHHVFSSLHEVTDNLAQLLVGNER